jgi:SOS response umuD protein. serine peptidase. MEROPS family S24
MAKSKKRTEGMAFFRPERAEGAEAPLAQSGVHAGFPSPADDFIERRLDLGRALVPHPEATFFARVEGDSMKDECIEDGDLLVVDKSVEAADGDLTVSYLDGEFTLKRIRLREGKTRLVPANPRYEMIEVTPENDFSVWGVVTFVVKKVGR